MYFLFGIFFALCIFCLILFYWKKRHIIRKICCMNCAEKCRLLNDLIRPFGFEYLPDQDIFTSRLDAWQREFGYCAAFDTAAPHFNMVFDRQPIYFDYDGRTWLIEFWKGQYGINIGTEIGVYQADRILSPEEYETTLFHSVPDEQLLRLRMEISLRGCYLFCIERLHWWLTGFRMGEYCEPDELEMQISICFPNEEMLHSFEYSMDAAGYLQPHGLACRFAQWKNRIFCRLFCLITKPFTCTVDRILYLYYFLPIAFRRAVNPRKYRSRRRL